MSGVSGVKGKGLRAANYAIVPKPKTGHSSAPLKSGHVNESSDDEDQDETRKMLAPPFIKPTPKFNVYDYAVYVPDAQLGRKQREFIEDALASAERVEKVVEDCKQVVNTEDYLKTLQNLYEETEEYPENFFLYYLGEAFRPAHVVAAEEKLGTAEAARPVSSSRSVHRIRSKKPLPRAHMERIESEIKRLMMLTRDRMLLQLKEYTDLCDTRADLLMDVSEWLHSQNNIISDRLSEYSEMWFLFEENCDLTLNKQLRKVMKYFGKAVGQTKQLAKALFGIGMTPEDEVKKEKIPCPVRLAQSIIPSVGVMSKNPEKFKWAVRKLKDLLELCEQMAENKDVQKTMNLSVQLFTNMMSVIDLRFKEAEQVDQHLSSMHRRMSELCFSLEEDTGKLKEASSKQQILTEKQHELYFKLSEVMDENDQLRYKLLLTQKALVQLNNEDQERKKAALSKKRKKSQKGSEVRPKRKSTVVQKDEDDYAAEDIVDEIMATQPKPKGPETKIQVEELDTYKEHVCFLKGEIERLFDYALSLGDTISGVKRVGSAAQSTSIKDLVTVDSETRAALNKAGEVQKDREARGITEPPKSRLPPSQLHTHPHPPPQPSPLAPSMYPDTQPFTNLTTAPELPSSLREVMEAPGSLQEATKTQPGAVELATETQPGAVELATETQPGAVELATETQPGAVELASPAATSPGVDSAASPGTAVTSEMTIECARTTTTPESVGSGTVSTASGSLGAVRTGSSGTPPRQRAKKTSTGIRPESADSRVRKRSQSPKRRDHRSMDQLKEEKEAPSVLSPTALPRQPKLSINPPHIDEVHKRLDSMKKSIKVTTPSESMIDTSGMHESPKLIESLLKVHFEADDDEEVGKIDITLTQDVSAEMPSETSPKETTKQIVSGRSEEIQHIRVERQKETHGQELSPTEYGTPLSVDRSDSSSAALSEDEPLSDITDVQKDELSRLEGSGTPSSRVKPKHRKKGVSFPASHDDRPAGSGSELVDHRRKSSTSSPPLRKDSDRKKSTSSPPPSGRRKPSEGRGTPRKPPEEVGILQGESVDKSPSSQPKPSGGVGSSPGEGSWPTYSRKPSGGIGVLRGESFDQDYKQSSPMSSSPAKRHSGGASASRGESSSPTYPRKNSESMGVLRDESSDSLHRKQSSPTGPEMSLSEGTDKACRRKVTMPTLDEDGGTIKMSEYGQRRKSMYDKRLTYGTTEITMMMSTAEESQTVEESGVPKRKITGERYRRKSEMAKKISINEFKVSPEAMATKLNLELKNVCKCNLCLQKKQRKSSESSERREDKIDAEEVHRLCMQIIRKFLGLGLKLSNILETHNMCTVAQDIRKAHDVMLAVVANDNYDVIHDLPPSVEAYFKAIQTLITQAIASIDIKSAETKLKEMREEKINELNLKSQNFQRKQSSLEDEYKALWSMYLHVCESSSARRQGLPFFKAVEEDLSTIQRPVTLAERHLSLPMDFIIINKNLLEDAFRKKKISEKCLDSGLKCLAQVDHVYNNQLPYLVQLYMIGYRIALIEGVVSEQVARGEGDPAVNDRWSAFANRMTVRLSREFQNIVSLMNGSRESKPRIVLGAWFLFNQILVETGVKLLFPQPRLSAMSEVTRAQYTKVVKDASKEKSVPLVTPLNCGEVLRTGKLPPSFVKRQSVLGGGAVQVDNRAAVTEATGSQGFAATEAEKEISRKSSLKKMKEVFSKQPKRMSFKRSSSMSEAISEVSMEMSRGSF